MRMVAQHKVMMGLGVVAAGMTLSSTAYACTVYKGQLTASGNGTGNVAQTVKAQGTPLVSGMDWCAAYTPTVKVATTGTISLATASTTCGLNTTKMGSSGTYSVSIETAGYMPQGGGTGPEHNCHGAGAAPIDTTATVNGSGVFTNGAGTGNTESYTTVVGNQNICIYSNSTADAIAINYNGV